MSNSEFNAGKMRVSPNSDVSGKFFRGTGSIIGWFYRLSLVAAVLAVGLLIGGFLRFTASFTEVPNFSELSRSDGIIVLTGGPARLTAGFELLNQKMATRLLISGVNPDTSDRTIQNRNAVDTTLFNCCVDIDREAADTIGNAQQAAKWMARNKFESLTIVTNAFHIPRTMLEMQRAMPQMKLQAAPVHWKNLDSPDWFLDPPTLRFIIAEYTKYVGARLRLVLSQEKLMAIRSSMTGFL